MNVGDRIVSTCGSLYRGCEGVITAVHPPNACVGWTEYSVAIETPGNEVLGPMKHACHFDHSQFVPKEADLGREHDRPCRDCCCRLCGHSTEVLP